MADPLGATFHNSFAEQVAAFRLRLGNLVPTSAWDDIMHNAHDRAFMVAGATKADLLADLATAVDKSIVQGTTLDAFRRDFRHIVEKHGWHGWTGEGTKKGENWRTQVIYQTNMATSYAAGRHAQLVAGNFDYWVYRHGGSLEPRPEHLSWNNIALPPDHPFWALHFPPNGWGCSCGVIGVRGLDGVRRVGGDPNKKLPDNWQEINPRTGAPVGIDRGWAYAPGAEVIETINLAAAKIKTLPPGLGSDYGTSLAGLVDRFWPVWLAGVQGGASADAALVGVLDRPVLTALAAKSAAPAKPAITVAPSRVTPTPATQEGALRPEDWLALPARLRAPLAILMDTESGQVIYLLPGQPPIVVGVELGAGGAEIIAGFYGDVEKLRALLDAGRVALLQGALT